MPGAAGSWWAFLKARTGAHYVDSNHMGAQAARLSVLRSADAAASLSLSARGARERRVPGSREARLSSPRLGYPPRAGSCIISISGVAGPGLGEEEQGRKESASGKEAAASASPPCSPLGDVWQLNLGAPGDLGETPLRDLLRRLHSVSPS